MVAMVVKKHAIYRALDCFDLPTHWVIKYRYYKLQIVSMIKPCRSKIKRVT